MSPIVYYALHMRAALYANNRLFAVFQWFWGHTVVFDHEEVTKSQYYEKHNNFNCPV